MDKNTLKADGLLLLAALVWGLGFVAQREGMQSMGPILFNALRFGLGAAVLVPWAWRRRAEGAPGGNARALWSVAVAGGLLFLAAGFQQGGLVHTTAGKAGFLTGLYVILVTFCGRFVGHRAGGEVWLGAVLAVAGTWCLSMTESLRLAEGDALVLIGAVFWAAHMLFLAWASPLMHPAWLACGQFAVCAVLSGAVGLAIETTSFAAIRSAALPLAYGGLCSVAIGFTLQVVAQRKAPPGHTAVLLSLEAVFAAIGGWLLLDEVLTPRHLAGCVLVLAGMLVVQKGAFARVRRRRVVPD